VVKNYIEPPRHKSTKKYKKPFREFSESSPERLGRRGNL